MRVTSSVVSDLLGDINRGLERLGRDYKLMCYTTEKYGYIGVRYNTGSGHWEISPVGSRRELYFWLRGYLYHLPQKGESHEQGN